MTTVTLVHCTLAARGKTETDRLRGLGHLQAVTGRTLTTAASIPSSDSESAVVLGHNSARYTATTLVAQRGLRPTTAVQQATNRLWRQRRLPPPSPSPTAGNPASAADLRQSA
jgi:hypothetical protein